MKISVLASGSKGNSTLIIAGNKKILIDLGTSALYLTRKLKELNVEPEEITHILITHTHVDHVSGLKVFLKNFNPIVFIGKEMNNELGLKIDNLEYVQDQFWLDDVKINAIKTSHDVTESFGYIIEYKEKSVVYITDTGYINRKNNELLKNKTMYIIESNHDPEMLMDSKRPHHIKIRILGDKGHLSNQDCASYLKKYVGNNTKHIVLAHLSEEANTKELAYNTISDVINQDCRIEIATQNDKMELVEI